MLDFIIPIVIVLLNLGIYTILSKFTKADFEKSEIDE